MINSNKFIPKGYYAIDQDQKLITDSTALIAYKIIKTNEYDNKLFHLQLYSAPPDNYEQKKKIILQYYKNLIDFSKTIDNQQSCPNFIKIYDVNQLIVKKQKDGKAIKQFKYLYIIRQYFYNRKPLNRQIGNYKIKNTQHSQNQNQDQKQKQINLDFDSKTQYFLELLKTSRYLHKNSIFYNQISPYNLITCSTERYQNQESQRENNKDKLKIVDTYIHYVLSNGLKKQKASIKNHSYYLSLDILKQNSIKQKPDDNDSLWGLGMTFLKMITQQIYFENKLNKLKYIPMNKLIEEVEIFMKQKDTIILNQYIEKADFGHIKKIYQIIKSLLNCKLTKNKQQTIFKTAIKQMQNINIKNVVDDQEQVDKIKKQAQKQNMKFLNLSIHQKYAIQNDKEFATIINQNNTQQEEKIFKQYIQKVTRTIYSKKVLKIQNQKKGWAKGLIQYLTPNMNTVIIQFQNQQTIIADGYIQTNTGKIKKIKLFYKQNGFNPLKLITNMENRVNTFIEWKQNKDEQIYEKFDQIDIFCYNNKIVQDMKTNLKGVASVCKKQFKQKFVQQIKKFREKYQKQKAITLWKTITPQQLIPFFSSQLNISHLNLNKNNLNDNDFAILVPHNMKIFNDIRYLSLADNAITDEGLQYLCEASKKTIFFNFHHLQILKLSKNLITSTKCFSRGNHQFCKLEYLHLENNNINKIDEYSFSSLQKIKMIFLEGNNIQIPQTYPQWSYNIIWQ